jgi:hypothetical protein
MIIIDSNNFLHRTLHISEYYLMQYNNFHILQFALLGYLEVSLKRLKSWSDILI